MARELPPSQPGHSQGGADSAAPGEPQTGPTADGGAAYDEVIRRFAALPRDIGWLMVSVGVIGVILPGIPGTPFILAGTAVLAPGGPELLARLAKDKPKGLVHTGLKHVGRWLDDLERRYPRPRSNSS
ncbi:MAG: DUF454 family protein [Alphaproteobacteria bacterium]|nr:DUF454 family protein [Alphaproteobacteria bacterium]MBV8411499.1 DUF454 family protein [Alphaproteobacteria bacterium]